MKYPQLLLTTSTITLLALAAGPLNAGDVIWEGDVSNNVATGGNWDTGTKPARTDNAVFDNPATVSNQPSSISSQFQPQSITFNQAGWDLSDGGSTYAIWSGTPFITSNGAGTNRISALRTAGSNSVLNIGTGNTLIIDLDVSAPMTFAEMNGTGTFIANGALGIFPVINTPGGSIFLNSPLSNNNSGFTRDIPSGSTVGGTGSIQQTNGTQVAGYVFKDGSVFAPGSNGTTDTTADTFTVLMDRNDGSRNNNYTLEANSTMAVQLFSDGSSDMLYITGTSTDTGTGRSNVNLVIDSGVTLALSGTIVGSTAYRILEADLAGTFSGTFSNVTLNGNPLTDGVDYTIAYVPHAAFDVGTGYIEITMATVPEPAAIFLVASCGLLVGLIRLRRRQR